MLDPFTFKVINIDSCQRVETITSKLSELVVDIRSVKSGSNMAEARSSLPLKRLLRSSRVGAPRGPRERDQRVARLLDAAEILFLEKGPAGPSVEAIAKAAGLAKGTLYHYFRNRAEILEAVNRRRCQYLASLAASAIAVCDAQDWGAQLKAWTDATTDGYLATRPQYDPIAHDPMVYQRCVTGERMLVENLAKLLRDGTLARAWLVDDPIATGTFLFYGMHGLLNQAIRSKHDRADLAAHIARLFAQLVFNA